MLSCFPDAENAMATVKRQHILIKTNASYRFKGKFQLLKSTLQHYLKINDSNTQTVTFTTISLDVRPTGHT